MEYFIEKDNSVFVNCYAVEVYLDANFIGKSYRGYDYYSLVGKNVRYFGAGYMRFYQNEKELEARSTKAYPLAVPMIIEASPSIIDTENVQFLKNGTVRKCIVLTFFKNDKFMVKNECIQASNNVMIILNLLEAGKLDYFTPEVIVGMIQDAQVMNKVKLRIPTEEEEIFISERMNIKGKRARFTDNYTIDDLESSNLRRESQKQSTYQAWTGEDINASLISSANRNREGIRDKAGIIEMIVTGQDMTDIAENFDKQKAKHDKLTNNSKT